MFVLLSRIIRRQSWRRGGENIVRSSLKFKEKQQLLLLSSNFFLPFLRTLFSPSEITSCRTDWQLSHFDRPNVASLQLSVLEQIGSMFQCAQKKQLGHTRKRNMNRERMASVSETQRRCLCSDRLLVNVCLSESQICWLIISS